MVKNTALTLLCLSGMSLIAQRDKAALTPSANAGPPTQLIAVTNYPVQSLVFRGSLQFYLADALGREVSNPSYNFRVSVSASGPGQVYTNLQDPLPVTSPLFSGSGAIYGLYFSQPGTYTLTVQTVGTNLAISSAIITVALNVPTFVVTSTNDSGPGSLRSAMASADQVPSALIMFQLPPGPNTITLTSGPLTSSQSAPVIRGPGANLLTISGNRQNPVFQILGGTNDTFMISGLSIANGFVATGTDFIPGGGGVYSRAPLWLDHCVVSGNSAAGTAIGGGLFGQFGSSLLITNSLVTGNTSIAGGGGMAGSGLFAINSAIENNAATGHAPGTGSGGGVLTGITITNSTISGNTASGDGGGIAITSSFGDVISDNTTISGNSAAGKGGGIFLQDASSGLTLFLTTSTISANAAGSQGGGVYVGAGGPAQAPYTSSFADSLIAGNVNGDCAGCPPQSYPNFIGGNPLLGALQNNGGPTKTMLPLPGSPVIGAGQAQPLFIAYQPDPTPATDQRGFPRTTVANAPIDLGAVQTNYALAFTQQPATVYSGTPLSWSVRAQESGRNYAPNANLPAGGAAPTIFVTLSLTSGTGAILGNLANLDPATGIASFPALSIATTGSQSLRATSPGFAPVTSTPFTVAPTWP